MNKIIITIILATGVLFQACSDKSNEPVAIHKKEFVVSQEELNFDTETESIHFSGGQSTVTFTQSAGSGNLFASGTVNLTFLGDNSDFMSLLYNVEYFFEMLGLSIQQEADCGVVTFSIFGIELGSRKGKVEGELSGCGETIVFSYEYELDPVSDGISLTMIIGEEEFTFEITGEEDHHHDDHYYAY